MGGRPGGERSPWQMSWTQVHPTTVSIGKAGFPSGVKLVLHFFYFAPSFPTTGPSRTQCFAPKAWHSVCPLLNRQIHREGAIPWAYGWYGTVPFDQWNLPENNQRLNGP